MVIQAGDLVRLRPFRYTDLMTLVTSDVLTVLTDMVAYKEPQSQSAGLVIRKWQKEVAVNHPNRMRVVTFVEVMFPEGYMSAIPVDFLERVPKEATSDKGQ